MWFSYRDAEKSADARGRGGLGCGAILHSWIIGLAKKLHLYHLKLPVPIIPDYVKIA